VSSQALDGRQPTVAVVGGGITGLAAAQRLAADGRVRVEVVEGAPRTGGKLLRGEIAGVVTDLGAESLLARRPEGIELLAELGLGAEIVHPETISASVWSRAALRSLPTGHLMGVPRDLRSLSASGLVSRAGVARAALDEVLPRTPVGDDISVAAYVGARLGHSVVDRIVEPLLGGVYAGRAELLSLKATLPQVADASASRSLLRWLAARETPTPSGPVFAGLPGGLGRLTETLTAQLTTAGVGVRSGLPVRELSRTPTGWQLVVGPTVSPEVIDADAVVLALPAPGAARLLSRVASVAAAELAAIEYASMAIVTLALPSSAFEKPLSGSGFLVPAVERRLIKAATFSSVKWGWYDDPDLIVARCSIGRFGDVADLQRDDDELIAGALRDLAAIAGLRGVPRDAIVTRWGGALPQYAVGHRDRVARIKDAVALVPGLAVAGAAFDGVGIPACIGSGQAAATRTLRHLFDGGQSSHE
jgi:oxygen-dependent protoporphyrinogen oxidase